MRSRSQRRRRSSRHANPVEPRSNLPTRATTYWLALTLMVLISGVLMIQLTGADPNASVARGTYFESFWHIAEARAMLYEQSVGVEPEYRQPLVTYPNLALFHASGLRLRSANLLTALSALIAMLMTFAMTTRMFGRRAAIALGVVFTVHPMWIAYARTPLPYHWAACWVLLSLIVASGRGTLRWMVGFGIAVTGGLFLSKWCAVVWPVLLFDGWDRIRRHRGRAEVLDPRMRVAYRVAGGLILGAAWAAVGTYSWRSSPNWRELLNPKYIEAAPILIVWAAVSGYVLLSQRVKGRQWVERRFDRISALTLWTGLPLLSLATGGEPSPLIVVFPLLVFHAIAMFERLLHVGDSEPVKANSVAGALTLIIGIAGSLSLVASWVSAATHVQTWDGLAVKLTIACVFLLFALASPWLQPRVVPWLGRFGFVLVAAFWSFGELIALGHGDYTHLRASEQLGDLLLPTARLSGPWAAAFAIENHLAISQSPTVAIEGSGYDAIRDASTHYLSLDEPIRQLPAHDGSLGVEFIEVFHVVGSPLRLYRLERALGPRSAFEEGIALSRAGDDTGARERYYATIKGQPNSAAVWTRLGESLRRSGAIRAANQCYLNAIRSEPNRVAAHLGLASMYIVEGYRREALEHLEAALAATPRNPTLIAEVARLRADLAQ